MPKYLDDITRREFLKSVSAVSSGIMLTYFFTGCKEEIKPYKKEIKPLETPIPKLGYWGKDPNNPDRIIPLQGLVVNAYSQTSPKKAEDKYLNSKVNDVLEINYHIESWGEGPKYVWLEILTGNVDVSSMNYLYLKVKGGEQHPLSVKLEAGSKSDDPNRKLGAYRIGTYENETISSDKWLNIEIPIKEFREMNFLADPNMTYKGLSDSDLKNLGALIFVFTDSINRRNPEGTLFVKDFVFSRHKIIEKKVEPVSDNPETTSSTTDLGRIRSRYPYSPSFSGDSIYGMDVQAFREAEEFKRRQKSWEDAIKYGYNKAKEMEKSQKIPPF